MTSIAASAIKHPPIQQTARLADIAKWKRRRLPGHQSADVPACYSQTESQRLVCCLLLCLRQIRFLVGSLVCKDLRVLSHTQPFFFWTPAAASSYSCDAFFTSMCSSP
jgi:hypothetical protein